MGGTVIEVAAADAEFGTGAQLVGLEAMKMQHVLVPRMRCVRYAAW